MAFDRPALCLSGSYLLLGLAWIGLADKIMPTHGQGPLASMALGIGQVLVFVLQSACLLYVLACNSSADCGPADNSTGKGERKALLRVFALPLAVFVMAGGLGLTYSIAKQRRLQADGLQAVADLEIDRVRNWVSDRMAMAGILGSDDALAEHFRRWRELSDADSRIRVMKRLAAYQEAFGYSHIALVNASGEVLLAAEGSATNAAPGLRKATQRALAENRVVMSETLPDEAAGPGILNVDFVAPLAATAGSEQGRLVVALRADAGRIVHASPASLPIAGAEILLLRRDGSDRRGLGDFGQRPGKASGPKGLFGPKDLLAARLVAGEMVEFVDHRQVAVMGVGKAIPDTPWFLVAKVDRDQFYAVAVEEGIAIGLAAGVILAAAALAFVIRQRRGQRMFAGLWRQQAERMRGLQVLATVLDGTSDAIFAKDSRGRYLLLNEEALRIVGKPREAVVGQDDRALFSPAEAERIMADDQWVMERNQSRLYDEQITKADGRMLFQAMKSPLHDANGNVVGVFGVARDVTWQQGLIAQWRNSEIRFRFLAAYSSDWYWEQDEEFRFIFYSEAFIDNRPLPDQNEMLGRHAWDFPCIGISDQQWAAHRSRLKKGEAFRDLEYGWLTHDGRRYYVSVSGDPIFSADGLCTGYRGVARDISARRQAEAGLRQCEARLAAVIACALDGIVTLGQGRRITVFNPAAEAIFGYRAEEVLYQPSDILMFENPQSETPGNRDSRQAPGNGDPHRMPARHILNGRHRSGRQIVLEASISSHTAEAEVLQTFVLRDVTPQLATERRLRQLSAAVEQSPVSIVITDPGGAVEYVNPRFTQVSGYSLDEIRGRNMRIMKSGETAPAVYQQLWQTIRSGGEWCGEMRNRKKNGELFWEAVRIIPIVSAPGLVMNYMAVKEDITQRKMQEMHERQRQEQMLHTARLISMGETAAALAHELNQPLTAIVNFGGVAEHQLAASLPDLSAIGRVIRLINEQALHAGEIVRRIRDFLKKRDPKYEASNINNVILDTVRLAEISLRDRMIPIETDLALGLPLVPADRVQLEQVLFNLIKNAVEATEEVQSCRPGENPGSVRIITRISSAGDAVEVEVADRGCGLPNLLVIDIFAPFCSTKPLGMGMGLAICRGIVEAHAGKLWARANSHGGASFFFTLPIREINNE